MGIKLAQLLCVARRGAGSGMYQLTNQRLKIWKQALKQSFSVFLVLKHVSLFKKIMNLKLSMSHLSTLRKRTDDPAMRILWDIMPNDVKRNSE